MKKVRFSKCFPYLLILPSLVLLAVFCFYPMIRGLSYAFLDYQRNKPEQYGFIGLENFITLFTEDKKAAQSLLVSLKWVVSEVVFQLLFGLTFALILNKNFRGRGIARTICFAPWAVSGVLTTMLWILIYNDNIGFLNGVLRLLGREDLTRAWLSGLDTVFPSVVIAELWRGIPFFAINILAALQNIPNELYESARVDGGTKPQILFHVTLPFLKESIIFAALMRCIWEFQSVDMIMTMTDGGPINLTTTFPIYMYKKAIVEGNYGYGAALGILSFVILGVFAFAYLKMNDFGKGINEE